MVLRNPAPISPTNNRNRLTFKQIQTEDYDLSRAQKNVQDVVLNIAQALNFSCVAIGSQPNVITYPISTTLPRSLEFPNVVADTTLSYINTIDKDMNKVSAFRAPADDSYQAVLNTTFQSVAGPTILIVLLFSSLKGFLASVTGTVNANATISLNMTTPLNLLNNELISYTVLGNIAGTADLGPLSSMSFSRLR